MTVSTEPTRLPPAVEIMVLKIEKDHQRFRQIVKGRIRDDLRKFLTKGELIGKEGKHLISIPVRGIELPHFRYGDNSAGVGAGEGKEGDVVGKGAGQNGQGGTEAGQHIMEVDLTLDELAEILAEELKLPRIEPKGKHRITTVRDKYSGIRRVGPESLRHFKRSFKEALKRQIMIGDYDPDNPVIIPQRKDIRYRSWKEVKNPAVQRGHRLHDGRLRLHGRGAKGTGPPRKFLDRHLAAEKLRGDREPLHRA